MLDVFSGIPDLPANQARGFCSFNPRLMREGYGSRVCVCVSVTALAATYLI